VALPRTGAGGDLNSWWLLLAAVAIIAGAWIRRRRAVRALM